MTTGQIWKAMSGFYYVKANQTLYQTRARGVFRNTKETPLVGDWVSFDSDNTTEGVIRALHPRKNELVRPPICNVDVAVVVMSAVQPDFSTVLLDRFLVTLTAQEMEVLVYVSKWDLLDTVQKDQLNPVLQRYREIGYTVVHSDPHLLFADMSDRLVVLVGQSGAGKSSLLNRLLPDLDLPTGAISQALGRGKHTTRHVALHEVQGNRIADTPGFGTMTLPDTVTPEDLGNYFDEFHQYAAHCRFRGCLHQNEPNCQVREAVAKGAIADFRYEHYTQLYQELSERKPKYQKRK